MKKFYLLLENKNIFPAPSLRDYVDKLPLVFI